MQSIHQLDGEFKGLFNQSPSEQGDDESRSRKRGESFMAHFGWHFTAKQIADFENTTVSQAWDMPTIEALNIMSYLKAKSAYDREANR